MKSPANWVTPEVLRALRARLQMIRTLGGPVSLSPAALELAAQTDAGIGLTIDFAAERELGHPLVVLRVAQDVRPAWFGRLSARERDVALRVSIGEANKEIALALGISPATVKDHVHRILEKAGYSSRAQVIVAMNGSTR